MEYWKKIKSSGSAKVAVFLCILIFFGSLTLHKIDFPGDDLGRHLKNGEVFWQTRQVLHQNLFSATESDTPFVNHHWLSGVIFYFVYQVAGFSGLSVFNSMVLLLAFLTIFLAALKKADFWLVAALSFPAILLMSERLTLRPEIFTYLFVAIFVYLLMDWEQNSDSRKIFWLILLQILWVNLHIFFFIGPLLVLGFTLEKIIQKRRDFWKNKLVRRSVFLFGALILACLINPNGLAGATYFLKIMNDSALKLTENRSPFFQSNLLWNSVPAVIFKTLLVFFGLSFFFGFKRKPIFFFLAGLGSALAGGWLVRATPLFGLIFLPAVSANLNEKFIAARVWVGRQWPRAAKIGGKAIIAGLAAFFLILGAFTYQGKVFTSKEPGVGLVEHANDSVLFFKAQKLRGPIFNNFDIGNYLIFHLFPEERVFVDGRPEAYPVSFFKDIYLPMLEDEKKWQEAAGRYDFNAIFFSHRDASWEGGNFIWRRFNDPIWALVYADEYAVIFLKNTPENQPKIEKFRITRENAEEKIGYLLESEKKSVLLDSGQLFTYLERQDLALQAFQKVVAKWPGESYAWTYMGVIKSKSNDQKDWDLAVDDLKKSISMGEKTCRSYSYLGVAYARLEKIEKAKEAWQKAVKIDEECPVAKINLQNNKH